MIFLPPKHTIYLERERNRGGNITNGTGGRSDRKKEIERK